MLSSRDARAKPVPRSLLGIENQNFIFSLLKEDVKYTVRDIYEVARTAKQNNNEHPLNERTVRRAVDALVKAAFIIEAGRKENAVLYAKRSTRMIDDSQGVVPFAGTLTTVEHFIHLMADPELQPFKLKVDAVDENAALNMRKQLAFAILSAGEPGHNEQLKKVMRNLEILRAEFEHVEKILDGLLKSPIWYDTYRDGIGYQVRNLKQNNPDLYKLVIDLISGG